MIQMKSFHVKLLMGLALALCGLCADQWMRENVQQGEITTLNRLVYQKDSDLQFATNSLASLNQEVSLLESNVANAQVTMQSNAVQMAFQKEEIKHLHYVNAGLTNQAAQYEAAVQALEDRLGKACDGIERQNELITNLLQQRDLMVSRYNDEVKDRNGVVAKYNALAKQVTAMQNASSNHPPP